MLSFPVLVSAICACTSHTQTSHSISCSAYIPLPPCSAADAEQLVGQVNPAAFQKAATADDEGLEALREHVGLLKKVCRQKAVYCLKDVRRQVKQAATVGCAGQAAVLQAHNVYRHPSMVLLGSWGPAFGQPLG